MKKQTEEMMIRTVAYILSHYYMPEALRFFDWCIEHDKEILKELNKYMLGKKQGEKIGKKTD